MDEITSILSHRYPFLLVDRIIERVPGHYARGIKNVSINEWFFQGHFPDEPIMPGVLITEAIAQTAAFAAAEAPGSNPSQGRKDNGMLANIKNIKFSGKVVPGDQLELFFEVTVTKGPFIRGNGKASVAGKIVCAIEEMTIYQKPSRDQG